jgi:hypothetical protein
MAVGSYGRQATTTSNNPGHQLELLPTRVENPRNGGSRRSWVFTGSAVHVPGRALVGFAGRCPHGWGGGGLNVDGARDGDGWCAGSADRWTLSTRLFPESGKNRAGRKGGRAEGRKRRASRRPKFRASRRISQCYGATFGPVAPTTNPAPPAFPSVAGRQSRFVASAQPRSDGMSSGAMAARTGR